MDLIILYSPSILTILNSILIVTIAKAITLNWKFHLKESLYLIFMALVIASVISSPLSFFPSAIIFWLFLFLYFYLINHNSILKSISATFDVLLAYLLAALVFPFILFSLVPSLLLLLDPWYSFLRLSLYLPAIAFAVFISTCSNFIKQNNHRRQIGFLVFEIFCFIFVILSVMYAQKAELDSIGAFAVSCVIFVTLGLYIYVQIANIKHRKQQKEDEYKSLQFYTSELEQQQTAVRKITHDFQNILLSMDSFFKEKDWAGLEQYYNTEIKTVSDIITKDRFALEKLSKIRVSAIKSILAAKILSAQSLGQDIETSFEAREEINTVPIDYLPLVRMLGIILDNAIEALAELGHGKLMIGCLKNGDNIMFIVQNTCRTDIPKIHQLEKPGFSTKGKGRGLGLSNLAELVDSNPGITLETRIVENNFIQKLTISGKEDT